jgi:AraC-like DNA-binding protein
VNPVEDLLARMKIEQSRYLSIRASAPWGISFRSRSTTRLVMISAGTCQLTASTLPERRLLVPGDCFVVKAGAGFTLEDEPGRPAVDCEDVFACAEGDAALIGGGGPLTEIVSGRFSFDTAAAEPLLAALPPVLTLDLDGPSGQLLRATFDLLGRESAEGGLGAGLVTSRLADALFVQAIRTVCTSGQCSGWLAAMQDPQLAAALRALHGDLGYPWTVATLAREATMSRSAFAVAFKDAVGDTPLGYLTTWRIHRAKALLRETRLSLTQIALDVGYDSNAAFSRVFSRREGISPGQWRRQRQPHASAKP